MVIEEQLKVLLQGVDVWNKWRERNIGTKVYLNGAYLEGVNLEGANLIEANLHGADLREAKLIGANLIGSSLGETNLCEANLNEAFLDMAYLIGANLIGSNLSKAILWRANLSMANLFRANLEGADLTGASFVRADLRRAKLNGADLRGANLSETNLNKADLRGANLQGAVLSKANLRDADLQHVILVETNLEKADLSNCRIYGISAWNLKLDEIIQNNLIITNNDEPTITVDNLEVAQFIYLLLNNLKIRDVINTITSKVVLILGRFSDEQKSLLDAIREKLRSHNYCPVMFDFDKPGTRSTLETVTMLARMARFVIADLTDPVSIPMELVSIVQALPSVPIQPLLMNGKPWGMYDHIKKYPWVLGIHVYNNLDSLLESLEDKVIAPAEAKAKELID